MELMPTPPAFRCASPSWYTRNDAGDRSAGEFCAGIDHIRCSEGEWRGRVIGRCPAFVERERWESRLARREAEGRRLSRLVERANRGGGSGFAGFDPTLFPGAQEALGAMRDFAASRPPRSGVVLLGPSGLGKSRLQLAAHFALLDGGLDSRFIRATELRALFRWMRSYDEDEAAAAQRQYRQLAAADAVHLDDLGDEDGRFYAMAGPLKALVDESRGAWTVSIMLSLPDAKAHPDIGWAVISRLVDAGGVVVKLKGANVRARKVQIVGAE